jgi:hypothetical protein
MQRGPTYHGVTQPQVHVATVRSNTVPGPPAAQYYPQPYISVIPPNGKPIPVYGQRPQPQQQQQQYYYDQTQQYPTAAATQQYYYPTQSTPITSPPISYASPTRVNTPWFKRIFTINLGSGGGKSRDSSRSRESSRRGAHDKSSNRRVLVKLWLSFAQLGESWNLGMLRGILESPVSLGRA